MTDKCPDVVDAIPNHCRPLQTQPPSVHTDVRRESHRLQHFRSEHPAVADLDPLVQHRMEGKNLQGRLSVGVVCWLESQVVKTHLVEEGAHESDQIRERQPVISDDPFNLMELS